MGGWLRMIKIYDEPHWSGELKVYDSRNRQMRGKIIYIYIWKTGIVFKVYGAGIAKWGAFLNICDKPESSNGGVFKIYDEPNWSGVLKVYDGRNRQMRGPV